MPDKGCRHLAMVFNHLFATRGVRVGNSFVAMVLRESRRAIERERKSWRQRKPRIVSANDVWALDITGIPDRNRRSYPVLGILDHGSRRILYLGTIRAKASIALLQTLLDTIETFGKPDVLRTDNEPAFTSRLFRGWLRLLGIRHQRTQLHSP
jgi:transposase InsO family protein